MNPLNVLRGSGQTHLPPERTVRTERVVLGAGPRGISIHAPDGTALINALVPSYALASHYPNRRPPPDARTLELEHAHGLEPGDRVLVINPMYGGASRPAFQFACTVAGVEFGRVTIDTDLPPHMMRYTKGLVVRKHLPRPAPRLLNCSVVSLGDGQAVRAAWTAEDFELTADASVRPGSGTVDVAFETRFTRPARLHNLTISLDSPIRLSQAYLKNRVIRDLKDEPAKRDLWLWKEGARAQRGAHGWAVVHNTAIASCEIMTRGYGHPHKSAEPIGTCSLAVNLIHTHDHHFRRHRECFTSDFSTFEDLSLPEFRTGEVARHEFGIHATTLDAAVPRVMLVPHGFRAVNVWTEHADKTTIETHRAAYFGESSIEHASDATGGFVRHGHPVTKSVFFENPRGYANKGVFDGRSLDLGPMLSVRESPEFGRFLNELRELGHEICLHAARPDREARPSSVAERAVYELAERFSSPTVIDHALETIDAAAGFQGLVPWSAANLRDAWERAGVRYFWTWSSADFMPKLPGVIDLLHGDGHGAMPTPLCWRHPMLPDGAVVWGANECPLDAFNPGSIERLIADRGVSIQQHYYPFVVCDQHHFGFIERGENGAFRITEQFDALLATMAERRDAGELLLTTIGDLLSYWLACESIRITPEPRGFTVENLADNPISGLSLVVEGGSAASGDVKLRQRLIDRGDLLIWMDLGARQRARVAVAQTPGSAPPSVPSSPMASPRPTRPPHPTRPRLPKPSRPSEVDWLLDPRRGFALFFRPRCGSTTLTRWFFENMGVKFGGFSISAYRTEWLEPRMDFLYEELDRRYEDLHTFVVVRDPIDRCVSSYLHVVNNPADSQWTHVRPHAPGGVGKHDLTFRMWVDYLEKIDLDTAHIIWRRQSALSCWARGVKDVVPLARMNAYLDKMNARFGLTAAPTFNSVTVPEDQKVHPGGGGFFGDTPFSALLEYKGRASFEKFPHYAHFYDEGLLERVRRLYADDVRISEAALAEPPAE